VGPLSTEARAALTIRNLRAFARNRTLSTSDLTVNEWHGLSVVSAQGNVLFVATDDDAKLAGKSRQQLAEEHLQAVQSAVTRYRRAVSSFSLSRSLAALAAAILVGAGLLFLLRFVYGVAWRFLHARAEGFTRALGSRRLKAILGTQLFGLLGWILRLGAAFLGLLIISSLLAFIFGLFPETAGFQVRFVHLLAENALSALAAVINYMPNLAIVLIVAMLTFGVIRTTRAIAAGVGDGSITIAGFYPEWAKPTYDILAFLLIMFGLVVAFPYLPGGRSPAFQGISIFIGVLVSLGSQSAMGNIIAGVILTYMRPYQIGDRVRVGEVEGDVVEKSLLVTRIRTIKNEEVIVPNSTILAGHVRNFSAQARTHGLILHSTVTIGYDAPWKKVHELLIRAALNTKGILRDPAPFVFQTSLNDFHVSYEINAYTNEAKRMHEILPELCSRIQDSFNEGGIEIMSPTFYALRDGNTVTIPAGYRPAGYTPPSFLVRQQPPEER
jgi:small-conductance mechanosensitive channel